MPPAPKHTRRWSRFAERMIARARSLSLSPLHSFAVGLAAVVAIYMNIVPAYAIRPNPMDVVRQFSSHPLLQYGWPLTATSVEPTPDSYSAAAGTSYERLSLLALAIDTVIVSSHGGRDRRLWQVVSIHCRQVSRISTGPAGGRRLFRCCLP